MSTTTTPATGTQPQSGPSGRGQKRGGNRGRGGHRGRGRGQTNAGRTGGPNAAPTEESPAVIVQSTTASDAVQDAETGTEGEETLCHICTEPIKYFAVSECNHRTCHVCAVRLRALYKKLECVMCKEPQNKVVFTVSPDAHFNSYSLEDLPGKDPKLSAFFESQEMMEDTLLLLRFNCPDSQCDFIGNGWGDLKLHVRATHGKQLCDLCIRHKKVFSHEHSLYTAHQLAVHLPSLHRRGGLSKELPEGGIHPLCEFCKECYFGDDELYSHMREGHEECFICKRNGIQHKYFMNYEALERHFNNDHYPCTSPECVARKFVVFNTALDLKGHQMEEHKGEMSSKDLKDARRVQAEFAFEDTGRHGRREREREREPPPHQARQQQQQQQQQQPPQAGPSRQAGAAGGGGGGRRREAFGGALTTEDGPAPAIAPPRRVDTPPADVDPATAERHSAFLIRLRMLASHPDSAVPAVKAAARGYRTNEAGARDLILTIWNVLDQNLEHTASIVNAFVDLLDEEEKKQDLLASWKGFNIEQRRQFPDLSPISIGAEYAGITSGRVLNAKHATAARSASHTSAQILDRVARAAASSTPFTPSAPIAGSSRARLTADSFPALPSAPSVPQVTAGSSGTQQQQFRPGQKKTPWSAAQAGASGGRTAANAVGSAPSSSSAFPSLTPVSVNNPRPTAKHTPRAPPPKITSAAFPGLPTTTNNRQKINVSGNVSLKNILGTTAPTSSAWAQGSGQPSSGAFPALGSSRENERDGGVSAEASGTETPPSAPSGGGKGKKKQKQTLYTLGSFPA